MGARGSVRRVVWAVLLAVGLLAACGQEDAPSGAVHIMVANGTVGPIMEQYLDRGLDRAEASQAQLAVIELDTPGGLNDSMRDIVKRIQAANVPVAVFVTP